MIDDILNLVEKQADWMRWVYKNELIRTEDRLCPLEYYQFIDRLYQVEVIKKQMQGIKEESQSNEKLHSKITIALRTADDILKLDEFDKSVGIYEEKDIERIEKDAWYLARISSAEYILMKEEKIKETEEKIKEFEEWGSRFNFSLWKYKDIYRARGVYRQYRDIYHDNGGIASNISSAKRNLHRVTHSPVDWEHFVNHPEEYG